MWFAFLGSSGAIPSTSRDTTSIVFVCAEGALLIDCGGSPAGRLRMAGVPPLTLTHVLVTHVHPDHAYGLPALIQSLILLGRQSPLTVLSLPEHVDTLRSLLELFGVLHRRGMFPVVFRAVDRAESAPAVSLGPLVISTSPVEHGAMPNVAVRVDPIGGRSVVYSSDTAPSRAVVRLARGADTLIHEATFPARDRGRFGTHSTAVEAGEIAALAGVRRLILAHIEADYHDELDALADEARTRFGGAVEIARELVPYPL